MNGTTHPLAFVKAVLAAACIWALIPMTTFSNTKGVLEGRLTLSPDAPVQLGGAARLKPDYAAFVLIIRSPDGKKEIARTTPDGSGNYKVELPPGEYVLALEKDGDTPSGYVPQKFAITANKATHIDTTLLPNLSKSGPESAESR